MLIFNHRGKHMNYIYDENIGFESILPSEIIDLLNSHKSKNHKRHQNYMFMTGSTTTFLDEHELAMAE